MQGQLNKLSARHYTKGFREKRDGMVEPYVLDALAMATHRDTPRSMCLECVYLFNLSLTWLFHVALLILVQSHGTHRKRIHRSYRCPHTFYKDP